MQFEKTGHSNTIFREHNYFRHREWIDALYVSSLIGFFGLAPKSSVLDVGCGQGFFSISSSRSMERHLYGGTN